MFKGSFTALITPFKGGRVDETAFQDFVAWQLDQGSDGVVSCGTTGESPTLSHAEHMRVTELCVEVARGRAPVIAGTGSNSTDEAILLTKHAKQSGCDAALVVTPYYNRPTQEGLYQHYKAINDAVELPLLIYNIPGRCVVDMSVETMARLARLPNVVGVKDATNDLARPPFTTAACGDDFVQLSGEDGTVLAFLAQGGDGCISVTANVAPRDCKAMHDAWRQGDIDGAQQVNRRLAPLNAALFCETNPGPVKYAAKLLGQCNGELRLPMVEIREESRKRVEEAMSAAGLLA